MLSLLAQPGMTSLGIPGLFLGARRLGLFFRIRVTYNPDQLVADVSVCLSPGIVPLLFTTLGPLGLVAKRKKVGISI